MSSATIDVDPKDLKVMNSHGYDNVFFWDEIPCTCDACRHVVSRKTLVRSQEQGVFLLIHPTKYSEYSTIVNSIFLNRVFTGNEIWLRSECKRYGIKILKEIRL